MQIALVGDFDAEKTAHQAIPICFELWTKCNSENIEFEWLNTASLNFAPSLSEFDAVWVVPGSPYESFDNVLDSIRYVRENDIPFLGTCGGYQHAIVEFARNVLGLEQAGISEIDPDCSMPLISVLTCALIDESEPIIPEKNSLIERLCGSDALIETYRCSFGINPDYVNIFDNSDFQINARDPAGTVRAMALNGRKFFLGTAFQPERAALIGQLHPIVAGFLQTGIRA